MLDRASPCFDDEDHTLSQRKFMQPTFPINLEEDRSRVTVKISKVSQNNTSMSLSNIGDDSADKNVKYKSFTQRDLYKKLDAPSGNGASHK